MSSARTAPAGRCVCQVQADLRFVALERKPCEFVGRRPLDVHFALRAYSAAGAAAPPWVFFLLRAAGALGA